MARPISARLDWRALRHNHDVARRHVGPGRLWSVVKADAYGHGLLPAALQLAKVTDGLALVELEGAVALRDAGVGLPILLLEGPYQADELALMAELDLIPVLHESWQIDALIAARLPVRLTVYLKLNTGMNRLGFDGGEFRSALERLDAANCCESICLMTHFADADEPGGISRPLARFRQMIDGRCLTVSVANSAALLRFVDELAALGKESAGQWMRPGIMLYGASPFPTMKSAAEIGLRPVMTLESELIGVRSIAAGEAIGYGSTFVAEKPMCIGVVACGYADGYPRHAPTGTPILVGGERTRTLGRISMDKLCVDLTDLSFAAEVGDRVVLWGGDPATGYLSADEVASAAGTVAYELFCALAARVPIIEVGA